ncbi:MAG: bifunctional hydroxymethylpyrimidine kinase/phosphomethylpyrimidine kinase [bacterium]
MISTKCILCFSGHDPTGGAGIQADIEAIAAHGAHALTIPTCLTVQDSNNVSAIHPVNLELFQAQTATLIDDFQIDVVKIGLLGSAEIAQAVADRLSQIPSVPVVLDPVLRAGGGQSVADQELLRVIRKQLLPATTLATPNLSEARGLSGQHELTDCADWILDTGCKQVLITTTDDTKQTSIQHHLFSENRHHTFEVTRVPGHFHGSGCTLAANISARLALGNDSFTAVSEALNYTVSTLKDGMRLGSGQLFPRRITSCDS